MADRLVNNSRNVVRYIEMQHCDAVATRRILRGVRIGSGNSQCISAERVVSALTDAAADGIADVILDGEMQHGDAVAK